jgi:hypothetical protein
MARKPVHLFWGIVSLLVGAYFGYATARIAYIAGRNFCLFRWRLATRGWVWFILSFFPLSALAAYFIWVARNQFQQAGGQQGNKTRVRWGRLVLGFCIAFGALQSHFAPGLNALRPDNEAQAAGMFVATVVIVVIGIALMCLAFKPKSPKKEIPAVTLVR